MQGLRNITKLSNYVTWALGATNLKRLDPDPNNTIYTCLWAVMNLDT